MRSTNVRWGVSVRPFDEAFLADLQPEGFDGSVVRARFFRRPPTNNIGLPDGGVLGPRDDPARRGPLWRSLSVSEVQTHSVHADTQDTMVWFANEHEARSRRIGIRCRRDEGTFVLTVTDLEGPEICSTFDDEVSMTAEAILIHLQLLKSGWRALPLTESGR